MKQYEKLKNRTLKFTCSYCGCVFNANQDEYEANQYDGVYCYCPCCKEVVSPDMETK